MLVQLDLPQLHPGLSVQRVGDTLAVAKMGDPLARNALHVDAGADDPARVKTPINTARRSIERINRASLASHKDASTQDGGLTHRAHVIWKSEGPFDLQLGDVGRYQAGLGLISRIGRLRAPTIPVARPRSEGFGISRTVSRGPIGRGG